VDRQFAFQGRDQGSILRVDGADAAKMLVVFGHFQQPLARHGLAAQHVFQERNDVIRSFGPTERNHEHGIVRERIARGRRVRRDDM
jgi:hypothetical protein